MKNKYNKRKGATLAELIIVLAVLVIASTMVVSFSSMMHGAQGISNERFEAMQDVTAAESIIEGFIESNVVESTNVYIDENGLLTFAKNDAKVNLGFYKNINYIMISYFSGEQIKMEFENIDSISFTLVSPGKTVVDYDDGCIVTTTNDILYYCTINYFVDKTNYTYTFCVNPYAGEGGN